MAKKEQNSNVSKFRKNLTMTHSEIKGKRAASIEDDAVSALSRATLDVEDEIRGVERKIANLEDLYPTETTSLNPVVGSFDGAKWVNELYENKKTLSELNEALDILKEIKATYFEVEESTEQEG